MNQAFDVIFGRDHLDAVLGSVDRGAIWVPILTIGSDGEKILPRVPNTDGKIVVFIEAEMNSNYSEIAKEQQKSILMDISGFSTNGLGLALTVFVSSRCHRLRFVLYEVPFSSVSEFLGICLGCSSSSRVRFRRVSVFLSRIL
jgi:hypothetical protein